MRVFMIVIVFMTVFVRMMMFVAVRMRIGGMARIVVEHQRLHRHRHRLRGPADAAQVDVIQIPEHYAVDHQHFARDPHFLAQDRAQRLRDVAVEHKEQRPARSDAHRQSLHDAARQRCDALPRRRAAPAQGERDVGLAFDEIETLEVGADGPRSTSGTISFSQS